MNMLRRALAMPRYVLLSLILFGLPAFGQLISDRAFIPNRYTVILEDPPVSERFVTLEAMRSTPAVAYRQQIEQKQADVVKAIQARNITVTGTESTLLNAIFVTVTPDRLADLQSIPGVLGVRQMRRFKMALNKAVQLMNAPAAWNLVGGQSKAGAGIKIGDPGYRHRPDPSGVSGFFADRAGGLPQMQRATRKIAPTPTTR